MDWKRAIRHLFATRASLRRTFSPSTLSAIESAIVESEQHHAGEIRVAIEAALDPVQAGRGFTSRERALQVFSDLRVWDTHANNGVLIYVLLADRAVEIVADRGYQGRVSDDEWVVVCRAMDASFGAGRHRDGVLDGVRRVGELVTRHFPAVPGARNPDELPDRPVLL